MAEEEPEENGQEDEDATARKELEKRYRALQIEEQKKKILRQVLEPNAYERLMNVRIANPELYSQLLDLLIGLVQSNKIRGKVSDSQLKQLLVQLTARPEPSIQIKHK
ncbi:MAG: DNA-binding protein [Candidatus Micrarchaeia archaeon]